MVEIQVTGRYVLDHILSGEATEVVVENIHEYLVTVGSNVRCGKIKLDEFIIHKVISFCIITYCTGHCTAAGKKSRRLS